MNGSKEVFHLAPPVCILPVALIHLTPCNPCLCLVGFRHWQPMGVTGTQPGSCCPSPIEVWGLTQAVCKTEGPTGSPACPGCHSTASTVGLQRVGHLGPANVNSSYSSEQSLFGSWRCYRQLVQVRAELAGNNFAVEKPRGKAVGSGFVWLLWTRRSPC